MPAMSLPINNFIPSNRQSFWGILLALALPDPAHAALHGARLGAVLAGTIVPGVLLILVCCLFGYLYWYLKKKPKTFDPFYDEDLPGVRMSARTWRIPYDTPAPNHNYSPRLGTVRQQPTSRHPTYNPLQNPQPTQGPVVQPIAQPAPIYVQQTPTFATPMVYQPPPRTFLSEPPALPVPPPRAPTPVVVVGRPVSPMITRPVTPVVEYVEYGRPVSPMVDYGQPISVSPVVEYGRPVSPMEFSRPVSPAVMLHNSRPTTPLTPIVIREGALWDVQGGRNDEFESAAYPTHTSGAGGNGLLMVDDGRPRSATPSVMSYWGGARSFDSVE